MVHSIIEELLLIITKRNFDTFTFCNNSEKVLIKGNYAIAQAAINAGK